MCAPLRAFRRWILAVSICLVGTNLDAEAANQSAADFYNGRQMIVVVGTPAGGGYDLFARMIARYMGKYLPGGNASFIVRNMPGATGLVAANYTYNIAERDGSTFTTVNRETIFDPLFSADASQGKFDPRKFVWLGSPNLEVGMIYASTASKMKSIKDAQERESTMAASGGTTDIGVLLPKLLNELIGTKFKVIAGYPGSMDAVRAVDSGEVDGRYSPGFAGPEANGVNEMVAAGHARILGYLSPYKSAEFPELPNILDDAKSPEDRQLLELLLAAQGLGRPFFAPPGIPEDRVEALQKAFAATMTDPGFLADAKQQNIVIGPTLGPQMASFVDHVYATPAPLLQKVGAMMTAAATP